MGSNRSAVLVVAPEPQRMAVLESLRRLPEGVGLPVLVLEGSPAECAANGWQAVTWADLGVPELIGPARYACAALASYRLGAADALLVLGAGSRLLRPLDAGDLWSRSGVPYVFCSSERDLRVDPGAGAWSWGERAAAASAVAAALGVGVPELLPARGPAHLLGAALAELAAVSDLAELALAVPDASLWHGIWLGSRTGVPFEEREPIFKTLLSEGERAEARFLMETEQDFARGFAGVQLRPDEAAWADPPPRSRQLATQVPRTALLGAATRRLYSKAPRIQRTVNSLLRRG